MILMPLMHVIKLESTLAKGAPKCKYMIGTESRMVEVLKSGLLVRVGGGFSTLYDHVK